MSDMNFLEKLLGGVDVEWRALGALEDAGVLKLGRGNVISKNDLSSFSGDYPVYSSSASGSGIFGRYGKFMFEDERITWSIDGGGRFFHRQAHRYSVTNVCGWLRVNDTTLLNTRFLFHVLSGAWETKVFDYIKKAHPSVIRDEYLVPILSIEIQAEIVRILDAFTELTTELTAELTARKKQYNHYRDQLLSFEDGEVEWKTLGDISSFRRGSFPQPYGNSEWYDGEGCMPFVQVADVTDSGFRLHETTKQQISKVAQAKSVFVKAGTVLVTLQGTIGRVAITQYDCYVDRTLAVFTSYKTDINKKYFAHQLKAKFDLEKESARGSTLKTITKEEFSEFKIPVPSLAEQARIVAILDKFDALTNSITEGLPREIELRQKQYEYYRDLLLGFPKPEEAAA